MDTPSGFGGLTESEESSGNSVEQPSSSGPGSGGEVAVIEDSFLISGSGSAGSGSGDND